MPKPKRSHFNLLCDIGELATLITESNDIQHFLRQSANKVAAHLQVPVASIYLYDEQSQELMLWATVGLNPRAEHKIKMKPGEGLVGSAFAQNRPICDGLAGANPKFKYFPDADEERFNSLIAVPIINGVERIGVLVVQHEKAHYFDSIDVMTLRAAASQLSGAIGNARLLSLIKAGEDSERKTNSGQRQFIKGRSVSGGVAYAPACVFDRSHSRLLDLPTIPNGAYSANDFQQAVAATQRQLQKFQSRLATRLPESASLIFTAHFMMLKDKRFIQAMAQLIKAGTPAPEAIKSVARQYTTKLMRSRHAYLREKVHDIRDLAGRLLKNLYAAPSDWRGLFENRIIIARQLYPSEIMKFAIEGVQGLVLVGGGTASHVAILARSLKLPMIIAERPELEELPESTWLLLDADIGNLYVSPSPKIVNRFNERKACEQATTAQALSAPAVTRTCNGEPIQLLANINLLSELAVANQLNAAGVGLYRTEFPYLIRNSFPSEEEQLIVYQRLFKEMAGKPVTIRTLDVGGDKTLSYYDGPPEPNPELGLRSIRFALRHVEILYQQIRAILRAGAEHPQLRIMFPMISSLDELRRATQAVKDCMILLEKKRLPFHAHPQVGLMVEVPSVMPLIEELTSEAQFLSLGTNDFVQYLLAVDRANVEVAEYYQPAHPSVLRAIARIVQTAQKRHKELTICGEMAHEAMYIPFLLGVGIRSLSVDPRFLPQVRQCIARIDLAQARQHAHRLLALTTLAETKQALRQQAKVLQQS